MDLGGPVFWGLPLIGPSVEPGRANRLHASPSPTREATLKAMTQKVIWVLVYLTAASNGSRIGVLERPHRNCIGWLSPALHLQLYPKTTTTTKKPAKNHRCPSASSAWKTASPPDVMLCLNGCLLRSFTIFLEHHCPHYARETFVRSFA